MVVGLVALSTPLDLLEALAVERVAWITTAVLMLAAQAIHHQHPHHRAIMGVPLLMDQTQIKVAAVAEVVLVLLEKLEQPRAKEGMAEMELHLHFLALQ
jgi:uncharacterized membrane protein